MIFMIDDGKRLIDDNDDEDQDYHHDSSERLSLTSWIAEEYGLLALEPSIQ